MQKQMIIVAAGAALAFSVSSSVLAAPPDALANKPTSQSIAHDPVHEVRRVMAEAADRALGNNAVDGLLDLVNKPDRDRIDKGINNKQEQAYQDLAKKVEQIWKDKYGHKFSAEGHVDELDDLKVNFTGTGKDQKATVDFPPEPGAPAYELHLVRQKDNNWWRIELPDSFDGKTFYSNLQQSLQRVVDEKDKLPGAENKAYERVVTWILHEMAFPKGAK